MMVASGKGESFVIRVWLEGSPDGLQTWRGHVQHVQGSEETHFQTLGQLEEFLERVGGFPLPWVPPKTGEANE